jgi:hypothetical protein
VVPIGKAKVEKEGGLYLFAGPRTTWMYGWLIE